MKLRDLVLLGLSGLFAGAAYTVLLLEMLWPAPEPPIFDVQVQYNQEAWSEASPEAIIDTLDRLRVTHALVSSNPNSGTLKLLHEAPLQIVPMLSIHGSPEDQLNWLEDDHLFAQLEHDLKGANYRAIGTIRVPGDRVESRAVDRLVALALGHDLVLQVDADASVIPHLFAHDSRIKVLWAHAGLTAKPDAVGDLLDRFPNLWVDLSYRTDLAPDRWTLAPEWRTLFDRHPDRFMMGSGTSDIALWQRLQFVLAAQRRWLQQLPPALAERIAYKNAMALFGRASS